jgi:predicted metal-dependent HD superfamily phosphohydrolase
MVNSSLEGYLRGTWLSVVETLSPDEAISDEVRDKLIRAYSEPHRHYHNHKHLEEVFAHIYVLEAEAENRFAVNLAAWFHDVVYDPRAHDNEERSAEIAATELKRLGVKDVDITLVRELILATRHTDLTDPKPDFKVLLDADLAILGLWPQYYERYAEGIRREYEHVPEADYRKGRTAVLSRFLDRPYIFHTAWMRKQYEPMARDNLAKEIEALKCD